MAISFSSSEHEDKEEDYIDMEVSSSTAFLCYTINSPPQHKEFEFHMSSSSLDMKPSTSPVDELFLRSKRREKKGEQNGRGREKKGMRAWDSQFSPFVSFESWERKGEEGNVS